MRWNEQDPLRLFLRFLGGAEALELICRATNERASIYSPAPQNARPWQPIHANELCHWLGLLIYMARHTEKARKAYWEPTELGTGHNLGQWMSDNRWNQIHRHLSINNQPLTEYDSYWHRVEPLASLIRNNCRSAVKPSTWVAVDEGMAAFTGRLKDKVLLKNKPILEGFKL